MNDRYLSVLKIKVKNQKCLILRKYNKLLPFIQNGIKQQQHNPLLKITNHFIHDSFTKVFNPRTRRIYPTTRRANEVSNVSRPVDNLVSVRTFALQYGHITCLGVFPKTSEGSWTRKGLISTSASLFVGAGSRGSTCSIY